LYISKKTNGFYTFITKNYQEIKSICKKIDRVNYEDLCHDVNAIENNKYKAYIWKVAKNEFIDNIDRITLLDCEDLNIEINYDQDYHNEIKDLIIERGLSHIEKLWLKAFLERDLNSSWVSSSTGISRQHAKERYDFIIKKLKQ
jgi:hypothetical protein